MKEDSYEVRREMADMHNEFLEQLTESIVKESYIQAVWLCYAMFEQRTSRIIAKYVSQCPKEKRKSKGKGIKISTKIKCIKGLCEFQYGPFAYFDITVLDLIAKWCEKRNRLVHGLISIEYYEEKKYSEEFKKLAKEGYILVERLYTEATKVREWYRCANNIAGVLPDIKCGCEKKCYYES